MRRSQEIKDVLIVARTMLADPGVWGQFPNDTPPKGRLCAGVAIGKASRSGNDPLLASQATFALMDCVGEDSIVDWNDDPETTLGDVLAMFDKAISAC